MQIHEFPYCCKARIISSFGAGHIGENDDYLKARGISDPSKARAKRYSKEEVLEYLKKNIEGMRSLGIHVVFACPTSNQPEAIEALEEFGFFGIPEGERAHGNKVHYCGHTKPNNYVPDKTNIKVTVDHYMVPMFYSIPCISEEYAEQWTTLN